MTRRTDSPEPSYRPSFTRLVVEVLSVLLLVFQVGCQSRQIYPADRLPPQLAATYVGSAQSLDLARIARSVGNSEVIYPGDVVEVTITTGVEDTPPEPWQLRIAENGTCNIPLLGTVQLGGMETTQAEKVVHGESIRRGQFVNPNVSVVISERRSNRVNVMGAVESPGIYDVPASQSDLLAALMMAGSLTEDAGTVIEIRHPPNVNAVAQGGFQLAGYSSPPPVAQTVHVDLQQAAAGAPGDYRVFDGTTVMVMKKPKRYVHVMGLVNRSDQYEMPDDKDLRLLDAISMAGGLKLEVADKVRVMRRLPDTNQLVVIEASVRKAKTDGVSNISLAADDWVSVEETPVTFVVGTIRDFVRFGFTGGVPGL